MSRWLANLWSRRRVGAVIGRHGITAVQGAKIGKAWVVEATHTLPFNAPVFAENGGLLHATALEGAWRHLLERVDGRAVSVILPDPTVRLLKVTLDSAKLADDDTSRLVEHHAAKKGMKSGSVRTSWKRKALDIVALAAEASLCELLEKVAYEQGAYVARITPMFMNDAAHSAHLYINEDYWTLRLYEAGHLGVVRTGWTDEADWHEAAAEDTQRYIQSFVGSNPVLASQPLHLSFDSQRAESGQRLQQSLVTRGLQVACADVDLYATEGAARRAAFLL